MINLCESQICVVFLFTIFNTPFTISNLIYYLLLLFSLFLFIVFFSDFNENFALQLEMKKEFGTKTPSKINSFSFLKTAYLFFTLTFCSGFTTIIPLSLDSFNSYGEKNIENIWSFDEVINIEIILLFILFLISQFPTIILIIFGNENEKKTFFTKNRIAFTFISASVFISLNVFFYYLYGF